MNLANCIFTLIADVNPSKYLIQFTNLIQQILLKSLTILNNAKYHDSNAVYQPYIKTCNKRANAADFTWFLILNSRPSWGCQF